MIIEATQTLRNVFEWWPVDMWMIGEEPTGCASPMFPPTTVPDVEIGAGNMGKCSPSPTCPQAQQQQSEIRMQKKEKVIHCCLLILVMREYAQC